MTTASNLSENIKSNFLKLSGGTMTGSFIVSGHIPAMVKNSDINRLLLCGGTTSEKGAYIRLSGKDEKGYKGGFDIQASDGTNKSLLLGRADGTLTWGGKEVERVNSKDWNYVRYENGFQICRFWITIPSGNIGTRITYPMPFVSNPAVNVTYIGGGLSEEVSHMTYCIGAETATGCAVYARNVVDQSYNWDRTMWVIAIGQWK